MAGETEIRPQAPIRRFDVFAEYNKLKGLERGLDKAHAEGYGLWVAKVVASGGGRRGAQAHEPQAEPGAHEPQAEPGARSERAQEPPHEGPPEQEWHVLSGEPQTDALFEREVVRRMG